ncbi:Glu/Leu/Phe/Val dehydrogenase dimerization domain-containing protein [Virgisporangium aurantiacum]|nr:Glu/Leu/Phe/Val dehydrogenase dimerization domain-containing protein [Virgisporangium aurantiacum]
MFEHEEVRMVRGSRSGLPVIVAVHSTALGQAVGGLRMWHYSDWRDGLADALRLARGMTYKAAAAGATKGGGKTVVALPAVTSEALRRDALLDAGDVIESFGGRYATAPDVGTSEADMDVIATRTPHVFCRPLASGGSGDSSPATAAGVVAALRALGPLAGRRFAVVGLGRVGGAVASTLAAAGAALVVTDVDPSRRALADSLGATWVTPAEALTADVDVVVPAALGGLLTAEVVPALRCTAIAGPANNQLADDAVADLLHARGIVWAPDYVVSMGGVINAIAVEIDGASAAEAAARVDGIGDTVRDLLDIAGRDGVTPARAAMDRARSRLAAGLVHSGRD